MTTFFFFFLACRSAPADSEKEDSEDSDSTVGDEGPLVGVIEVHRDETFFVEDGLVEVVYEMTEDHLGQYRGNDGGNPRFHVVARPEAFGDGVARPALVWLHGGVLGIEGAEVTGGTGKDFCTQDGVNDLVSNALYNHPLILAEMAAKDWMFVVPESTWCDFWVGLGVDDPVDPNHASARHVYWTLDALEAGLGGLKADPEKEFVWGTSIGGAGVFPVAYGYGESPSRFAGVVSDSGPLLVADWEKTPSYMDEMDHILGGPAYDETGGETAFFPNYERVDASLLVENKGFRVPTFMAFNTWDGLTDLEFVEPMGPVLDTFYRADDTRYFYQNFDHLAPGQDFHTQTQNSPPPMGYTAEAALRFLEGKRVMMLEAEELGPEWPVDSEDKTAQGEDRAGQWPSRYSLGVATFASEASGAGTMWEAVVPDVVPRDEPIDITFIIEGDVALEAYGPSDGYLTLELKKDGEVLETVDVTVGSIAYEDDSLSSDYIKHVDDTRMVIDLDDNGTPDLLPEGELVLSVYYHGRGNAWFDGVWVAW